MPDDSLDSPTNRHALDAALGHTQRLATLGTLTGMIAHEFNNLLTPILSYSQMALDAPADLALTRKALEKAAAGAEKAARIAEAILELARESQTARTPSESCSISAAVKSALGCLAREPRKDGIALRLSLADAGDVAMRPVSLQQVVLNLLLNARKALLRGNGSGGGMELVVSARQHGGPVAAPRGGVQSRAPGAAATDACVEIVVADTGCGICHTLLPRVFDAWMTDGAPNDLPEAAGDSLVACGTGLGLAMCVELVHAAGGWMWVKSEVGEGTQVGVVLPAAGEVTK